MKHKRMFRILALAAIVVLLLTLIPGLIPVVHAATITVNTTDDELNNDSDCSLREAVQAANSDSAVDACPAGSGADIITLPAGTYTLAIAGHSEDANANGDLDLTSDITLNGAGAENTVIDANQLDRVLQVHSGATVELNGLTITNGQAPNGGFSHCRGGGVHNEGTLTILDSVVSGNAAGIYSSTTGPGCYGGGVYNNNGPLTIENSVIRDNRAGDAGAIDNPGGNGGGVSSRSTLIVRNCIISNNRAGDGWGNHSGGDGGGVDNFGTATIENSLISANSTGDTGTASWDGSGGGVSNSSTLTITNSTISGNEARGSGGGLANNNASAETTLVHNTVTDNTADADNDYSSASGGGLFWGTHGNFNVKNSIIAGNIDVGDSNANDCNDSNPGQYTSQGYNLVGSGTGCPSGGTGDQTTSDAKLGPLADNGGHTHTHALQYDSPAVEQIPAGTNGCNTDYTTDQRGATRPGGGLCDVGAYESSYIFWTGDTFDGGYTNNPGNWSGDIFPAVTDIPVFRNFDRAATVNADLTVAGWIIDSTYTDSNGLNADKRLTVNGDWLQMGGWVGVFTGTLNISGDLHLSGGSFTSPYGTGLLTVGGGFYHTGGTFDPESSRDGSVVLGYIGRQTASTAFYNLTLNDGLLGYWKLDEGTGTTAADASGYRHDGTVNGGPAWDSSIPATMDFNDPYALHLDRSPADYVDIANTTDIDNLQQLTLSAWVRLDTMNPGEIMRFVTLRNEKAVLRYDGINGPGQLHFYMKIDGSLHSIRVNDVLSAGAWLHVVGTYDGSTMRLYLNGVEQDANTVLGTVVATGDGVYFSKSNSDGALDGLLDDVRIYNRALSGTEISDLAEGKHPQTAIAATSLGAPLDVDGDLVLNSGTLAQPEVEGYWKLDEGAGTTAADSSANSNNGTLNGDPTWTTDTPDLNFADPCALQFDRSAPADYMAIAANPAIDDLQELSLSTWVNLDNTPSGPGSTYMRFVQLRNGKAVLRYVDQDGTGKLQFYMNIDGNNYGVKVDHAWQTGAWYHVAGTYNGSEMRLYLDGVPQGSPLVVSGAVATGDGVWLSHSGSDEALDGLLDDVRIYSRALSASEVVALADGYDVRDQDITIGGDFVRNGGVFEAGGGSVTFDGSGMQTLDTDVISLYDLTVDSEATLTTVDVASVIVEGAFTNSGATDETKTVSGAVGNHFDLAEIDVDVTTQGSLSSLQVVRRDTAHPQASSAIQTDKYWTLTPTGTGYTVDLTKPHASLADPHVCRFTGADWDCDRHTFDGESVTRQGVSELSDWAAGDGACAAATTPTGTSISLDSGRGADVFLSWTDDPANASGYEIHRSTDPYFTPGSGSWLDTQPAGSTSYTDVGAAGSSSENYSYIVRGIGNCGAVSGFEKRLGEFDFELVPGNE